MKSTLGVLVACIFIVATAMLYALNGIRVQLAGFEQNINAQHSLLAMNANDRLDISIRLDQVTEQLAVLERCLCGPTPIGR